MIFFQKFRYLGQYLEVAAGAYDFVFMTAIALALIPCVMVQFILNEPPRSPISPDPATAGLNAQSNSLFMMNLNFS